MATDEGKSLLFMLPCILPDARVTILVLPLVSLRGDLLRRVGELGIDHLVQAPIYNYIMSLGLNFFISIYNALAWICRGGLN